MFRRAALAWWCCLGCLRSQAPALPASDVEVGTTILVVLEAGRPTEGWVHAGREGAPLTFAEGLEVGLLELAPTPSALSLPLGRLAQNGPGRPLPLKEVLRALRRDASTGAFVEANADEAAALAELRLPPFDYAGCMAAGCLEVGLDYPLCKTTCSIDPPRPPELPQLAEPTGWALDRTLSDHLAISRPVQPALIDCPVTEAQLPGQAQCTSLLRACSGDGWPVEDVDAYVDPAAPPGGDGTRVRPYARIDEALLGSAPPTRLGLAVGQHAAPAAVPAHLELFGACRQTVLVGELVARGQRLQLRDLSLESAGSSLTVLSGAVGLERVLVTPAVRGRSFGWVINGGTVSATAAVFVGTWGGVELRAGQLHLTRAAINVRGGPGIRQRAGRSTLAEVVVRAATASAAWGLQVDGGQQEVRDSVIEGFADGGLRVDGRAEAHRVVIRRNAAVVGGSGLGIYVKGGVLTLTESEVSEHPAEGLRVVEGGEASLRTVRFLDNASRGQTHGVVTDPASQLSAQDLVLSGAHGSQLFLEGNPELPDQPSMALFDVVALGVRSGVEFEAVVIDRTGPVEIQRALAVGGDNGTIVSANRGSLSGNDWTLVPRDRGLRIFEGARFELSRVRIEGGSVPISLASNNLIVACVGTVRDLEVLAGPQTRTGVEVGRADVSLERYRVLGTGDNTEAVSVIQAPGRLEDGTAFGHLRARDGFISGWTTGFSLASEAQAAEALPKTRVENTTIPVAIPGS